MGTSQKKPYARSLDYEAYAQARARGLAMVECARLAGSKARTSAGLCTVAKKIEARQDVTLLLEKYRREAGDVIPEVLDPAERDLLPPAESLNEDVYALSRAQALPIHEAARRAGSTATDKGVLASIGRRLEDRPRVQALILKHRERFVGDVERQWLGAWEKARERVMEILNDEAAEPATILRAVELVARLTGHLDGVTANVQVLAVGEEARQRLLAMAADPQVQRAALDRLARLTEPEPVDAEVVGQEGGADAEAAAS